jgi:hypothetical protein
MRLGLKNREIENISDFGDWRKQNFKVTAYLALWALPCPGCSEADFNEPSRDVCWTLFSYWAR